MSISFIRHYPEEYIVSPNRSSGINQKLGVVLHHTAGSYAGDVAWTTNPQSGVSYHVLIAKDGRRTVTGIDNHICWHAGASEWKGRSGCNFFTLGVGFEGNTYEQPLAKAQIDSFLEWFLPRAKQYGWAAEDVTDHRTVSPGRKTDLKPSELARVLSAVTNALTHNQA